MNRRKGRKDEDFNRNSKLLISRESPVSSSGERQLFNPRSDHPIAFNKVTQQQPVSPPTESRPAAPRRLWSVDNEIQVKKVIQQVEKPVKKAESTKPRPKVKKDLSPEEQQKEEFRLKWKTLIASLRAIEADLDVLTTTLHNLNCFDDPEKLQRKHTRKSIDQPLEDETILVEQDIIDAEKIWREKIQLHLTLGEKYLEILRCDLDYAEKKGLESLCWKRAVYSLVDQFRRALKKASEQQNTASNTPTLPEKPSELAALLLEETGEKSINEMPVMNDGNGMIFVKVETPKETATIQDDTLLIKQTRMILSLFLEYLDLADQFYQKLTLFLKSVDDEQDEAMENYLSQWRRTKKYKWYSCISLRGDLARYRWSYIPEADNLSYDEQEKAITSWTKQQAFEEAWKRYFLGVWLMPAKGNLYFNLSLLLQQAVTMPGYEFHKLYFSTRSLMVRRNGFLNARESMLILFESNRRWINKHVEVDGNSKQKRDLKRRQPKTIIKLKKDAVIPALFVRLHGMLFTKIGLDEFSKVKRLFFGALFQPEDANDTVSSPTTLPKEVTKQLSESHMFWFETIILCLSSLYTYDYANAKLTKLLSCHANLMFYSDSSNESQYQTLLEDLGDSILFTYEIDLTCQIAVELFKTYLDPILPNPTTPDLPKLPHVSLSFPENKDFLFGHQKSKTEDKETTADTQAWLIYIEMLLHWMVLNGICIRSETRMSLWESLVGDITYDLVFQGGHPTRACKISPGFWTLLLQFLNTLLSELSHEDKYDMINKYFMEDEEITTSDTFSDLELAFAKNIMGILGKKPDLPEEDLLRGLGWVDEIHGRFLKLEPEVKSNQETHASLDTVMRRKLKILEYGFTLVKHLDGILYYDPVEEKFTVFKDVEEKAYALEKEASIEHADSKDQDVLYEEQGEVIGTTITEMDDDVLLSSETDYTDEKNEGDDIMTQLKKRREQLQTIVASAEQEERFGYRRLPARAKEREARLNYLRKRVVPQKTVLVLDTNCFIGHIDHIKKLFQAKKWSIIVPLVVVTELDGLRTNPQRLGLVAQQGIELLQQTLADKPKQSTSLRIQTSHNNFMNDISIRSEQFVFGETDKNLDDLVLSSCLWWISQHTSQDPNDMTVPVCLVTGDKNLSVKARARDVEVIPVSAVLQLTPP